MVDRRTYRCWSRNYRTMPRHDDVTKDAMATELSRPPVAAPWQDPSRTPAERAADLAERMTLAEKVAQLVGIWVGADPSGGDVAPHQADMTANVPPWPEAIRDGMGQLTRPYGTVPVEPLPGARSLATAQAQIVAANRFGVPAQVHEECLTGFAAYRATAYPTPLAWGAAFDPALVEQMAARIGTSMRAAGVHQGLAPVLDVTRDYRWGRTEETIAEDPYLVGLIGAAYVRGLENAGVVATLKHFAGYSASRAGRNLAPVTMGPRDFADVLLVPFEMALLLGGARSVMHSYTSLDRVPTAADEALLTDLLRDERGFTGTVVADYFGVRFLQTLHRVAEDPSGAAALALRAGVDVELPTLDAYATPLLEAVRAGRVPESLVDRALLRVLTQKAELGLLDADWRPDPATELDLDDPESRQVALDLARKSVVLLANDGVLPLAPDRQVAVVGPLADDALGMLGCYSFPVHVGVRYPDQEHGIEIPTVLEALRSAHGSVVTAPGCDITDPDRSGIAEAVELARQAEVSVAAVGDRSGLFGRGSSGEGRDAEAIVQAFCPGELGGQALAEVLTGAVSPSGRLPVSVPRAPGSQPGTYLSAPLGRRSGVSNLDPTPAFPFGHGLGYATFAWEDVRLVGAGTAETAPWPVDGEAVIELTVQNTGPGAGADVVQVYLHDPVAQVVRPIESLVAFARVELAPGERARVRFTVPADLASFTGLRGTRVVEPGAVELRVARSSTDVHTALQLQLVGPEREMGHDRRLVSEVASTTAARPCAAAPP